MKILIMVFSPAGSTLKIANLLEEKLIAKGNQVQLLNITGDKAFFEKEKIIKILNQKVKKHDLICIGSPVYEKHLEFYMKKIIEKLPKPDEKWGKFAIPFVTYGGISSGVALKEAVKLLEKVGRTTTLAMKIESTHIVTEKLTTKVNIGMPGDEALPVIDELVKRIGEIKKNTKVESRNFSKELNAHSFKEKVLCKLMNERMLHKYKYPAFKIVNENCNKCYQCIKSCSIQRIELVNDYPNMIGTKPECIHCFACVNSCKSNAITFENDEKDWAEIERILKLVSKENSFIRSMEEIRSAVYPLNKH